MPELRIVLLVSAFVFSLGLALVLSRRNAILLLAGIELMLAAANLNLVAFWHEDRQTGGLVFVLLSLGVAGAEAAVGLALIVALYRRFKTTDLENLKQLKG